MSRSEGQGRYSPPKMADLPWASFSGYGGQEVRWHLTEKGALGVGGYDYPEITPRPGQMLWIVFDVAVPQAPQSFWCLFEPRPVDLNGWGPDERHLLADIAIVRIRILNNLQVTGSRGVAQVEVEDVCSLATLAQLPPAPAPLSESHWSDFGRLRTEILRSQGYILLSFNFEGDLGAYSVISDDPQGRFLLIHGLWGVRQDHMWAGRVALDAVGNTFIDGLDQQSADAS